MSYSIFVLCDLDLSFNIFFATYGPRYYMILHIPRWNTGMLHQECFFLTLWICILISTWSWFPLIAAPDTEHTEQGGLVNAFARNRYLHRQLMDVKSTELVDFQVVTRSEAELSATAIAGPRQLQATWLSGVMSCHRWTLQCSVLSDFIRTWTRYKRYALAFRCDTRYQNWQEWHGIRPHWGNLYCRNSMTRWHRSIPPSLHTYEECIQCRITDCWG